MQTQVTCPNCGTPYSTEVHQLIDVGRNPQLKEMLLSGQLNVAVCPSCGAAGQLSSALVYHDPAHELFMIYVPQELNLDQVQREEYIGQLTRQVMDATPAEQRRGYMLQPKTILTMQSFLENVLETEGITKEMIERQRKQAELLNTLATADPDVVDYLVKERSGEIDETFFAMLKQYVDTAAQMNDNNSLLPLLNLQAKLMTETEAGREMERRQIALHGLNRDAKAAGGLTPEILLKHVISNRNDPVIIESIAQVGLGGMNYDFFAGLSAEIERLEEAGDQEAAKNLTAVRSDLLSLQEQVQEQTQQMLNQSRQTMETILNAEDMEAALQENADRIDDAFMYVLAAELSQAEESQQMERAERINTLREMVSALVQGDVPPEVHLLNEMVHAGSDEELERLVVENEDMLSTELMQLINVLQAQMSSSGRTELIDQIGKIKQAIAAHLEAE